MNTKKSLPILLSFSLAILLYSYPAILEAATYYVSNSGSATWAQCTNINTPCAVQIAFNNAVAGDIVYFRGGTYNVPVKNFGSTYHGYYEPANSGTSGNPITFAAYTGETPIFNGTAGGTGDVPEFATIFGTFGRSYIVFDGFTFQADNGTRMARVHIGSDDPNIVSIGITVKNCIFNGGSTVITSTDNREGLRVDYVSGLTAQRNRFYNYRQTSNWHNTSAVKMYHNTNIIFENNEIYNCSAGLYYKSDVITAITRYNYIHDCYLGIFSNAWAAGYNMDGHTYSHNVISNCSYSAIHLLAEGGTFNNLTVNNNTIYNSSTSGNLHGILIGANANYNASNSQTVHSNIILGTTYKLTFAQGTISESQYNQYGNAGSFNVRTHYGAGAATYTSLTAWHNSTEVVGGVHPEGAATLNGLASNPLFQNSSGNMSQLNDFRLANNSPSKGTGKGGVDMGANIDNVGTGGSSGDAQAPTVPDGLSAQAISSSQINLSWTASTDNVGVTEYRIYRNNAQIATTTSNTSYSDTGLSSSTTYTYNVSAYDAAGNNSAQSSSASATTQAGGGSGGNNSNGDTSASGGGGCGFVKKDGKGQRAKGEGVAFAIMLIIALTVVFVLRRATKTNHI